MKQDRVKKNLKKLSRAQLLEMMVELSEKNDALEQENDDLQRRLKHREIEIDACGSIAQAALQVNEVFTAAQKAADQYLENIRRRSGDAESTAAQILERAQAQSAALLAAARSESEALTAAAQRETEEKWTQLHRRLERYCMEHELLESQFKTLLGGLHAGKAAGRDAALFPDE